LALASGEYVALMDNDDEISEHALYRVAKEIVTNRDVDMLYSDEDKLDLEGNHVEPFFKPDWSPEYMLSCMYTCHLGVYRASLVREIGGFRTQFDSAQDYDLVLRIMARTEKIRHIPDVLYHWRMLPTSTASGAAAKPKAHEAARTALEKYLAAQKIEGKVDYGPAAGLHRVRYSIRGQPKIAIIIPSTCRPLQGESIAMVERCINSIIEKSSYKNYEIIVLDRKQMSADMEKRFLKLGVKRVSYNEPFNWSRVNNLGVKHTDAEQLLFLNDDTEILTCDWLESMLEHSQRMEIGAVGAKLLFPDGKVQHAGVTVINGLPGHPFYLFNDEHFGYYGSLVSTRNYIAVTGACLMSRMDVFNSVGGFDEFYPLNYNDVDYCLKVHHSGKRIVYTPYARLKHYESVTRPKKMEAYEMNEFRRRWYKRLHNDPYYNQNLTQVENDFGIGF
jgi:O-antigen biosynthesis protein